MYYYKLIDLIIFNHYVYNLNVYLMKGRYYILNIMIKNLLI